MRLNYGSWFRKRHAHKGYRFDRPLLLIHSDDWGRVGVRDWDAFDQLCAAGIPLGNNPYDFYSLETAEDVGALQELLVRHRDSAGRCARVVMNFVTANLDFPQMAEANFRQVFLRSLQDGFPGGWKRPGLIESYRSGIALGVFHPGLHGTSHFCPSAVNRALADNGKRAELLTTLWRAETPYIFHLMPWIGYEYWDGELPPDDRQLDAAKQMELIRMGYENFVRLFGSAPASACAPGYRSDRNTRRAWRAAGINVAQNGPGRLRLPSFSEEGVLNLYRNINFEPATDKKFSVEGALRAAGQCFERGAPAIVSMHSINLHSTLKNYRASTLNCLDRFLTALENAYPDLLYVHDAELFEMVTGGGFDGHQSLTIKSQLAPTATA